MELFACDRLSTKLTRASCGQRYERAQREAAGRGAKGQQHLAAAGCTGCPTGAAHARGEAPDVELVELRTPHAFKPGGSTLLGGVAPEREAEPTPEPTPLETKNPEREDRMTNAKTYTYRGKELTVVELAETEEAKANGLTTFNIYDRLKRMSAEEAVATPKGRRSRATRVGKARTRAKSKQAPTSRPTEAAPATTAPPPSSTETPAPEAPPLRLVLYAAGIKVAESTALETWAAAARLVQSEAG